MAQEPSLSELYSYTPRPELAQGDRNIVPDDRQAIQSIADFANKQTQLAWNKYAMFQDNFQKNFDKIKFDYEGIAPQHREELQKDAADFYKIITKDPSILGNPSKNPALYGELMNAQQKLQSKIEKSKSINKYTQGQEQYMHQNPDLLNETNKGIIKQSLEVPIDQWNTFNLKLPSSIDFNVLTKAGLERATVSSPVDEGVFDVKLDKQGKPIVQKDEKGNAIIDPTTGKPKFETYYTGKRRAGLIKSYDQPAYEKQGAAIYDSDAKINKYGVGVKEAAKDMFNTLPEQQRADITAAAKEKGEKDPIKYFFQTTWNKFYDPTKDLSNVKVEDDKAFAEELRFKRETYLELLKQRGHKELEAFKISLGKQDEKEQAKALIQFSAATLGDALKNGETKKVRDNGEIKEVKILNLPPQVSQLFGEGEKIVSQDGRDTITMKGKPDHIEYNPSDKTYTIVVYKRKKDGEIETQGGWNVRDENNTKKISEAQFMATLGKDMFTKDKLPKAYQFATEMLGGGSLEDYLQSSSEKKVNAPQKSEKSGNVAVDITSYRNKYNY